jgi:hypothetical protein
MKSDGLLLIIRIKSKYNNQSMLLKVPVLPCFKISVPILNESRQVRFLFIIVK